MIRRVGTPPKPDRKYTARPGVYAILPLTEGLLLTLQSGSDEALQLPGGGIDPGESPLRALHREVFEETGWSIAAPRRLKVFRRFVFMPDYNIWAEKVCTIYLARPVRKLEDPLEIGHQAQVVDPALAAELLGNIGDRMAVRWARARGMIT